MIALNPLQVIRRVYDPTGQAYRILVLHSRQVASLATQIGHKVAADGLPVDHRFIREAAWLHDIGMSATDAPEIGCYGQRPYICHGIEGRSLLESMGFPRHAIVCERHTGVGLTAEEIVRQQLPLPVRDMVPISLEETIIAYADLFYSKSPGRLGQKKTTKTIRRQLARFGPDKVDIFDQWHQRFT